MSEEWPRQNIPSFVNNIGKILNEDDNVEEDVEAFELNDLSPFVLPFYYFESKKIKTTRKSPSLETQFGARPKFELDFKETPFFPLPKHSSLLADGEDSSSLAPPKTRGEISDVEDYNIEEDVKDDIQKDRLQQKSFVRVLKRKVNQLNDQKQPWKPREKSRFNADTEHETQKIFQSFKKKLPPFTISDPESFNEKALINTFKLAKQMQENYLNHAEEKRHAKTEEKTVVPFRSSLSGDYLTLPLHRLSGPPYDHYRTDPLHHPHLSSDIAQDDHQVYALPPRAFFPVGFRGTGPGSKEDNDLASSASVASTLPPFQARSTDSEAQTTPSTYSFVSLDGDGETTDPIKRNTLKRQETSRPIKRTKQKRRQTFKPIKTNTLQSQQRPPILEPIQKIPRERQRTTRPIKTNMLEGQQIEPTSGPIKRNWLERRPSLEPVKMNIWKREKALEPIKILGKQEISDSFTRKPPEAGLLLDVPTNQEPHLVASQVPKRRKGRKIETFLDNQGFKDEKEFNPISTNAISTEVLTKRTSKEMLLHC